MKKIVVIGSLNVDIVVKVDHIVRPGETISADTSREFFGGKGANQAYAVAKAGGEVAMIGKVGSDDYGIAVINNLKKVGVDTSYITIAEETPTGFAFITVDKKAENGIVVVRGANKKLGIEEIKACEQVIEEADVLLIQQEIPKETIEYAINLGYEKGKYIILNPAPVKKLDDSILSKVNLITPNQTELAALVERDMEESEGERIDNINRLAKKGVKEIILTLGSEGVLYYNEGEIKSFKAYEVEPVDTTGAGDCFNGYLAACYGKGLSMEDAIDLAQKAASVSITKFGAQTSTPDIGGL